MLTLLLIGALISVFGAQSVKAEPVERKVGVEVGDWIKYSVNATFYSNDPEQLKFASVDGTYTYLELEYVIITVQNVSGTTITAQNLLHFKNGTEKEVPPYTTDVNGTQGGMFISADLSAGDTLFPDPDYPYFPRINETIYREYLGEIREINHINLTRTEAPGYTSVDQSAQEYFDRATGIFVELNAKGYCITTEGYVTNGSRMLKICDTNLWGIDSMPEFNIIAYVFSFALITITISIVYLRQRKKQQT
jgi:hypothetical protein